MAPSADVSPSAHAGHKERKMDRVNEQLSRWRSETEGKPLHSAQKVQDRLLDLYGALKAYPIVSQIEAWLKITNERQLFEDKEINELLDEIELGINVDSIVDSVDDIEAPEHAGL